MVIDTGVDKQSGITRFAGFLINLLFIFIFFVFIFFVFRLIGFLELSRSTNISFWDHSIPSALLMGFRYDSKVLVLLMLPMIVAGIPLIWLSARYYNRLMRFIIIYSLILAICLSFIEIVDYNYFKFFKHQINVDVFGIIYDDTSALIQSIVSDFPIILISGTFIVVGIVSFFVITYVAFRYVHLSKLKSYLLLFLLFPLIALGARGSFGTFPLQKSDRAVSSNPQVNELVMNGFYALLEAKKEFSKGRYYTDPNEIIKLSGYKDLDEIIAQYGFDTGNSSIDSLFVHRSSVKDDDFESPNVVVIFMEGMGTAYYLPETFLYEQLGELSNQLPYCDVFNYCMPGGNLTVNSIESFILGTIDGPLCQSKYIHNEFRSSIAFPFKDAGYNTIFITGGKLDWRNFGSFFLKQGFQESVGLEGIMKSNKSAQKNEWGVFDEYLFEYLFSRLNENEEPKFVFALTTSNHIPYDIPKSHTLQNLSVAPFGNAISSDTVGFKKNQELYYYAANQVGVFLQQLRQTELGENTIVVITGDHTIRHRLLYPGDQLHKNYAVPLIIYLPDRYRKPNNNIEQWVSHRDINNTICEIALSDTYFFGSGINLYDSIPSGYFGVNANNLAISENGITDLSNRQSLAWTVKGWNGKLSSVKEDSLLNQQFNSLRAYTTLLRLSQASMLKN